MYARRSPEEVHAILRAVGADYVVLENSICYERRHGRGCRLRDLLDLSNGHVGGVCFTWPGVCRCVSVCVGSQPPQRSMSSLMRLFVRDLGSSHRRSLSAASVMSDVPSSGYLDFQRRDRRLFVCLGVGWMCVNTTNTHNLRRLYKMNVVSFSGASI